MHRATRNRGFTVLELMIVLGMIGVLSGLAISLFSGYQLRSKRTEAMTNLSAISRLQKTHFAEQGTFNGVTPQPGPGEGAPGPGKRSWTAGAETAFGELGWRPEGEVFYDYDTNSAELSGSTGCSCTSCFTSTAYGDLDGNGQINVLMYVHQDENGSICNSAVLDLAAPVDTNGDPIYDTVAVNVLSDPY